MKRVALLLLLAGCGDEAAPRPPDPVTLNDEAIGHYCRMNLFDHAGPQAQLHLDGYLAPIWFAQVRDAIAYLKSPEKDADVLALYVNDVGAATGWNEMGADNWIVADAAYYVVGSDAVGGMGAPEVVPFAERDQAEAFASEHGGQVDALEDIPVEAVLAPVDRAEAEGTE